MRADRAPEDELCLLLVRGELSPEFRQRALALLASPLRWPLALDRARRYQILPLLYRRLQTLGFPGVPAPVQAELGNIFRSNAMRNELLGQELARILRLLGEAGIPVMPLKGVALGERLYDDPAVRTSADIDILVPVGRVAQAFHLIVAADYTPEFTEPELLSLLARYGKDCTLVRVDRACVYPLELHCALIWGGSLERQILDQIWSEAVRRPFGGVPAFALSPEWELLYLAVHAARHGWVSLKWFIDLDRFAAAGLADTEKVRRLAERLGWQRALQSSLATCASLLGTPVDPRLLPRGAQRVAPPAESAGPLPSGPPPQVPRPSNLQELSEMLLYLSLLRSPLRKLRYLASRLFIPTPADCEFLPLPSRFFFLYYPLRPLRVAWRTAAWLLEAAWRAMRRG